MKIQESGNDPQRYGVSRWAYPKFYDCDHSSDCKNPAKFLYRRQEMFPVSHEINITHNCCGGHEKEKS